MSGGPLATLALLAALGCGLMAGLSFAFSAFVMAALGRLPPAAGIAAMQSIDRAVPNPLFFAVFFGTAAASAALALAALLGAAGDAAPFAGHSSGFAASFSPSGVRGGGFNPIIDICTAYATLSPPSWRPAMPRTVSIFRNNRNQAIRLPKDFEFQGVTELTIERQGDTILLRPVRPDWLSFAREPVADGDFMRERPDLIEEGRFSLDESGKD